METKIVWMLFYAGTARVPVKGMRGIAGHKYKEEE